MSGTPILRKWQKQAEHEVLSQWSDSPSSRILVAACPGAGKTWVAVSLSIKALREKDIDLVVVVAPTVNIKEQWCSTFRKAGIRAHARADNEALRFRVDNGLNPAEDNRAICITYGQIARDADLFSEMARRLKTLVIADEVHHADDKEVFGSALECLSEEASLRLALSGTPFNSSGGALAMCPSVEDLDDTGRPIRRAKPAYSYSYGDAIKDGACRPVEFIKVLGRGTSTYKSLANNSTWKKVIDLAKQNKTDSIGPLLDVDGEFFLKMAKDALSALHDIKRTDPRAAMLVVAKDKDHGAKVCKAIESLCSANSEWSDYQTLEVYNDTPKAHQRIEQLESDSTDIVVTVKMISEGVDVKRLRVGLYATDYRTRMFFTQFVGRFVRWEDRLGDSQHARVIIPAHPDLINFARDVEQMVDQALIPEEGDGGGDPVDKENEYLGTETEAGEDGVIWRGQEQDERKLAELFFQQYPSLRGQLPESLAISAAKDANLSGAQHQPDKPVEEDWSRKNDQLVRAIVRLERMNGDDDDSAFRKINKAANKAVGIRRKDKMTPVETLKERHQYLKKWLQALRNGEAWSDAA